MEGDVLFSLRSVELSGAWILDGSLDRENCSLAAKVDAYVSLYEVKEAALTTSTMPRQCLFDALPDEVLLGDCIAATRAVAE